MRHGKPEGLHYLMLALWCAVAGVPVSAHHSAAAMYDADHSLTLTGHVFEFVWRNPHCFLYLDVDAGPFAGKRYVVEMSSLGVLGNNGWTKATVQSGDVVRITVLPARSGKAAGLCRDCPIRINGASVAASVAK